MIMMAQILTMKQKQKKLKKETLVVSLSELTLTKKTLIFTKLSMKYFDISNNHLKILKKLLELGFKSDNLIKAEAIIVSLRRFYLIPSKVA